MTWVNFQAVRDGLVFDGLRNGEKRVFGEIASDANAIYIGQAERKKIGKEILSLAGIASYSFVRGRPIVVALSQKFRGQQTYEALLRKQERAADDIIRLNSDN